jgi:neutral ceramidase
MPLLAGVARTPLTPPWGVELAGWGYYLGRTWKHIRDHTAATALVLDDGASAAAVVAVDLMYLDAAFTRAVRDEVARHTPISPDAVCVSCSHSHNTPTAALIRGAGEQDAAYVVWAARQTATAVIMAYHARRGAMLHVGSAPLSGWTYNRTRSGGAVDMTLGVWRVDDERGGPLAALVNFQGHPTIQMALGPADLSRDVPGQVTDLIEATLPGITALYLQGACGDVNFDPAYLDPARCHEPGRAVAGAALGVYASARPVEPTPVKAKCRQVVLPTRRWRRDEVEAVHEECERRARTGSTDGWLDGFARVIVNDPPRLPLRYGGSVENAVGAVSRFGMEWANETLADLDTRPETITAEVQALRVGGAFLVANGSEFFSSLALDLRRRWGRDLLIATFANDSIGYMPDAHDVARKSYAAYQSPRFKGQFPFTEASGGELVRAMREVLGTIE